MCIRKVEEMINADIVSQLFVVVGVLVALVNIITEVAKKLYKFKEAGTINIFVTAISILLTMLTFVAYWQIKGLSFTWYLYVTFVIIGFMVAYAAMFGFDKLIAYFKNIKGE